MRKLAAGNWKMNGTSDALSEVAVLLRAHPAPACEMLICPPTTLLSRMAEVAAGTQLRLGGQDCHAEPSGAFTGDVSAPMLADAGASHVIVGHSERRAGYGETDAQVCAKAEAAIAAGLVAVVCVGETERQRDTGATLDVIGGQILASMPKGASSDNFVVAYEPVWAIGTGRTPTLAEIAEVHMFLRTRLTKRMGVDAGSVRLLYGGSVKPSNAAEIFAVEHVDGALVGGASLKAADFGAIIAALSAA